MQHSRIRVHFASTAEDTRESGSTVGGIVAGVVTSLLVIIAATLGIIALIWLLRRCTSIHWECLNYHACVYPVGNSQPSRAFSQLVILKLRTNRVPRHMHKTFPWTSYIVSQDSVCAS